MNWKKFMEGLAVAALSGAATSAAEVVATGEAKPQNIKIVASFGAITGIAAWLRQSPIERKSKKKPTTTPQQ